MDEATGRLSSEDVPCVSSQLEQTPFEFSLEAPLRLLELSNHTYVFPVMRLVSIASLLHENIQLTSCITAGKVTRAARCVEDASRTRELVLLKAA